MKPTGAANTRTPLFACALLVAVIILSKILLGRGYVLVAAAAAMLWIPFLLDRRSGKTLGWNADGFIRGAGISLATLLLYAACFHLSAAHLGKTVEIKIVSPTLAAVHLLAVAFPEEFFFRGYLQRSLGGGPRAIAASSAMFALAHFLVICVFSGGGACAQNLLTFFPSLVMGYLYMSTRTLWSSVFFHFAANVVYLSLGFAPG